MHRKASLLVSFLWLVASFVFGQNEPTISTCDGNQEICLSATTYDLCVEIEVDEASTLEIESFTIEWGDGTETDVAGSDNPPAQNHIYNFENFFNTCEYRQEFIVRLRTFFTNGTQASTATFPNFINPPQANFSIPQDTICIGETAIFNNGACPAEGLEYEWDYGDGTTGQDDSHTYDEVGTFQVSLMVENMCGTDMSTRTVEVIGLPVANGEVVSGPQPGSSDPYIICLGGGNEVEVDASMSENETIYDWEFEEGSGYVWLTPQDDPTARFAFNTAGTYTLVLTVDNSCEEPDMQTFEFEVFDAASLVLNEQSDECEPFDYTPNPLIDEAQYEVDGQSYDPSDFPIFLDFGTHTVVATLNNECADQTMTDEFEIALPQEVQITAPTDGLTVCVNSGAIDLEASPGGGTWDGQNVSQAGNEATFDPATQGTFTITYTRGVGACQRTDMIEIEVIEDVSLTLENPGDTCISFNYTPFPLVEEASYTIDGTVYDNSDFPILLEMGSHTIEGALTNECGTQEVSASFTIEDAVDVVITEPSEPLIICVGSGPVNLVADQPGGEWLGEHVSQAGDNGTFTPDEAGTFEISYQRGNGPCERTDMIEITVIENIIVELESPGDTCIGYSYTPFPLIDDVTYTLDGTVYENADFPVFIDLGQHTVEASLSNECGDQMESATFEIATPQEVVIDSPDTISVCAGSETLTFEGNTAGGTWEQNGAEVATGTSTTFDPAEAGEYLMVFWEGYGPCRRADTVLIDVQGISAQANDIDVCPWSDPVPLVGTPSGGVWSSADCPECIDGDLFLPANLQGQTSVSISYTVSNEIGCESTGGATVTVLEPSAAFSILSACLDTPTEIDAAAAVGDDFLWRIDGQEVAPPPFNGLSEGAHTIELVAITAHCRDSISQQVIIVAPPSNAGFTADDERICPSMGISFTPIDDMESNRTYLWDFDRGPMDTSQSYLPPNPIVFENDTDTLQLYDISFTIANECGEVTDETTITVVNYPRPDIGIDSSRVGCSPHTILFTNRSTGNPDSCHWAFSDNFVLPSCQDTFSRTFYAEDTTTIFFVALTTANECGDSTVQDTITVIPPGVQAFYNVDDPDFTVCAFDTIRFEDASTPLPMVWSWDFGDGAYSSAESPGHVFTTPDTVLDVRLRVSTGCGFDEISRQIRILPAPEVDFELPPFGCVTQPVAGIVNLSPTDLVGYYWDFGNGTTDSVNYDPSPVFQAAEQTYPITLTVEDFPNRCRNFLTKELLIRELPVAEFEVMDEDTIGCQALSGQVESLTTFANQLIWNINGRTTLGDDVVGFSFGEPGRYPITLVASYDNICYDSLTKYVVVEECNVYIPNAFSPNNDGINDFFTLYGSPTLEKIEFLRIFDRWGNMVFENTDFDDNVEEQGWDGWFDGKPANSDVYVYYAEVRFIGGIIKTYKGDVTLLQGN